MRLPEMQNSLAHEASPEQQDVHFDELKTKVCIQAEQITQWSGLYKRKDRPVNSLEAPGGVGNSHPATDHHQDGMWGDECGDLLYNGRKGGKGGKGGKGEWIKGKGKGGKSREARCANCGKPGHRAVECEQPERPWSERPCHNCGETGHISFTCPKKRRPAHLVDQKTEPADQSGKFIALLDRCKDPYTPVRLSNRFAALDELGQAAMHEHTDSVGQAPVKPSRLTGARPRTRAAAELAGTAVPATDGFGTRTLIVEAYT